MKKAAIEIPMPFEVIRDLGTDAIAPHELDKIRRILARAQGEDISAPRSLPATAGSLWNDDLLKLDRASLFRALPPEARESVRRACSLGLLKEAQMIEVAGMVFTAKMALLARTLEERELYSLFAADEARHFRSVSRWAGTAKEEDVSGNPFLDLLAKLIRFEERPVLVFLIQVVLEGWGIHHYGRLARAARDAELGRAFQEILRDEAQHHGSGLLLFHESDLSEEAFARLRDNMREFLRLVRLGPGAVLARLAAHGAKLDADSIRLFLTETEAEAKLRSDLREIENLIEKVGAERLLECLRREGAFAPPSLNDLTHGLRMGISGGNEDTPLA